jgi:predicted dehydrogenase
MSARAGVALIGAGAWGRNYIRVLAGAGVLRSVCDPKPEAQAEASRIQPGVKVDTDIAAVLADPEISGVVIATDARSHHTVARAALEAGKDVLCEKPLTLSGETAAELVQLADQRGRILMVGHLLLHHRAVQMLRSVIEQGELGDVLYLVAQRLNLGVVRQDENAWWSLAPHDVALACYLLGAEPSAVSAAGGVFLQRERAIEDVVFATLHFPDARIAHLHVSWLDPHKTRRLTVVGSKKMAVFDDTSPDQKLALFDKGAIPPPAAVSYDHGVRVRTGDIRIPAVTMAEPLLLQVEAFLLAMRTRVLHPSFSGSAGLTVVRTLEAGSRSLAERGRRVELAEGSR